MINVAENPGAILKNCKGLLIWRGIMIEHRAHPRQRTYLGAMLEFSSSLSSVDCLLEMQAARASASIYRIQFPYLINPACTSRRTRQRLPIRLVWRNETACGFEFDGELCNFVPLSSSPLANLLRLRDHQSGGALVEYALIAGTGAILAAYEMKTVGSRLSEVFQTISARCTDVMVRLVLPLSNHLW